MAQTTDSPLGGAYRTRSQPGYRARIQDESLDLSPTIFPDGTAGWSAEKEITVRTPRGKVRCLAVVIVTVEE